MPNPTVDSARDKFVFLACGTGGGDAAANTAEQPVDSECAKDANSNSQPAD